ncbi:9-O-acetylesterase [Flavobacterium akiainvivens]|uniref:9-O-acetylesterase n=1 Tax=Flavobacterium akiainvivens TaxID=1202724 RepID=A0A0M8MAA7_9FLAO|nr:sialate O-acetylesterase [Flavobacterium akiainvivens]KOS05875.1 9-O-acetylesterase [Flavobacterium akiainvivens]SFQ56465.1 sialate O-acetylesterase [Flavobacterium akiainvivens]
MKTDFKRFAFFAAAVLATATAQAKVELPTFFTSNMVLQQKAGVPLWGHSNASQVTVTTSWDNKTQTVKTNGGDFKVTVKTPSYGGPYTITFNDGDTVVLSNILIGEVWLCSGQSNMEMPLEGWGKVLNYQEEIKNANYPQIRLLQAEHIDKPLPVDNLVVQAGGWQVCSPATIPLFSSTAYFFACKIYKEKNIPIGLVHSSWGGTVVEAWTSAEALRTIHDFDSVLDGMQNEQARAAQEQKYADDLKAWNSKVLAADKGYQNGKAVYADLAFDDSNWADIKVPSFFENQGFPDFDGVMWYRKSFELEAVNGNGHFEYYADDNDRLFVNGVEIGHTDGYSVLRIYTIPANVLKKGKNVIAIRVVDTGSGGGLYGPENLHITIGRESRVRELAGNWKIAPGVSFADVEPAPYMPAGQNRPSALYNAMIHPLIGFKFAGAIWYQGESNADRAQQYQTLFPLMIKDWREKLGDSKLPFIFVQLASYKQAKAEPEASAWAELREAQAMTLKLPNTGMIVATDIGDAEDIHPKNKQEVGERLARVALAKVYGTKIDYSGPVYKSFAKKGNTITVEFDFKDGLKANGGTLKGFAVAGNDQVFYWADAKIEGGKVVVSSAKVANPVAVRYNWADNPDGNLVNASGLPAAPFRTDKWSGVTEGRK